MRLAAIDIGTNSVHMIVVRVRPDFSFEIVDREKEMVRLGAGGLDGKKLTPEAMTAALQALSKFKRLAESHQVDEILAVATSATREAENGGAFLRAIERRTGIRARIITGTEEARLIHLAAVYGVDTPKPAVVIDIGGGSVEITRGSGSQVDLARSFKLGVIRLTERFVGSDPISNRDERKMVKCIREEVDRYVDLITESGFDRVIGTSGTILSLGVVAIALERGSIPQEVRNLRVPARSLRKLRKTVVELDLEERLRLPGLDPRRADIMVAGAILLDTLLKQLDADEITLCDLALREGVLLDYIQRHRAHIKNIDSYPDVRRRSVIELGERCDWEAEHAKQVAALALTLFDYTRRIHGLGDREREWLEYAGLLHDIGNHISYEKHHRHSYYLIKNGDLRGFEPEEIDVIALLTRYHRRATPKREHIGLTSLPKEARRTVTILSAFLRLAETLDRSRHGVVRGIEVRERMGRIFIKVQAVGDAELEIWAAHKQARALEEALERKVQIEKVPYRKASAPSVALVNNAPEIGTAASRANARSRQNAR
ncbi:MAG TPA: Ppx/GppA phosphatase family protein [Vicinamibacterales bacterium]|nr:Ppx/GppA phosphatase family protein [Vicinamibacterales bacterium]